MLLPLRVRGYVRVRDVIKCIFLLLFFLVKLFFILQHSIVVCYCDNYVLCIFFLFFRCGSALCDFFFFFDVLFFVLTNIQQNSILRSPIIQYISNIYPIYVLYIHILYMRNNILHVYLVFYLFIYLFLFLLLSLLLMINHFFTYQPFFLFFYFTVFHVV